MSDIISVKIENIKCPFCNETEIEVTIQPEYYSYHAARAFGKIKRIPVHHLEQIKVESNCPNCKATRQEIKEALEKGTSKLSHEERLKRLKESGLPTRIES